MFVLYVQDACPFSAKVLKAGEQMGIEFSLKNIKDKKLEAELKEVGGKVQTPYFVDTDTKTAMYGSDEIVSYIIATVV